MSAHVTMDLTGDPAERHPVSPYVELLWERGNVFEYEVIKRVARTITVLDGCRLDWLALAGMDERGFSMEPGPRSRVPFRVRHIGHLTYRIPCAIG